MNTMEIATTDIIREGRNWTVKVTTSVHGVTFDGSFNILPDESRIEYFEAPIGMMELDDDDAVLASDGTNNAIITNDELEDAQQQARNHAVATIFALEDDLAKAEAEIIGALLTS